jgi:hypothetical protein
MTDLTVIEPKTSQPMIFDMAPHQMVTFVTQVANVLADVIEKQKLYKNIQGKKYIEVDGWTTLGALLGVLPRETSVTELPDGSYVGAVDLVRTDSGKVVGGASSLCSIEEKRWSNADKYARRSMAVTRATGKSYRLAFSWIVKMAGYESTPAEEMDGVATDSRQKTQRPVESKKKAFDPHDEAHQTWLKKELTSKGVDENRWDDIALKLAGVPSASIASALNEALSL